MANERNRSLPEPKKERREADQPTFTEMTRTLERYRRLVKGVDETSEYFLSLSISALRDFAKTRGSDPSLYN